MGFFDRKLSATQQPTIWNRLTQPVTTKKASLTPSSRGCASYLPSIKTALVATGVLTTLGVLYYAYRQGSLQKIIHKPVTNSFPTYLQFFLGGVFCIGSTGLISRQVGLCKSSSLSEVKKSVEISYLVYKINKLENSPDEQLEKIYQEVGKCLNIIDQYSKTDQQKLIPVIMSSIISRLKISAGKDDQGRFIHDVSDNLAIQISTTFLRLLEIDKEAALEIAKTCVPILDFEIESLLESEKSLKTFQANRKSNILIMCETFINGIVKNDSVKKDELLVLRKVTSEKISQALNRFHLIEGYNEAIEFLFACIRCNLYEDLAFKIAAESPFFSNCNNDFDLVDIAKVYDWISMSEQNVDFDLVESIKTIDKDEALKLAKTCFSFLVESERIVKNCHNNKPNILIMCEAFLSGFLKKDYALNEESKFYKKISSGKIFQTLNKFLLKEKDDKALEFLLACKSYDLSENSILEAAKASILFLNNKKYFDLVDIAKIYNLISKNEKSIDLKNFEDYSLLPYNKPSTLLQKTCETLLHSALSDSHIRRNLFIHCIENCDHGFFKYKDNLPGSFHEKAVENFDDEVLQKYLEKCVELEKYQVGTTKQFWNGIYFDVVKNNPKVIEFRKQLQAAKKPINIAEEHIENMKPLIDDVDKI